MSWSNPFETQVESIVDELGMFLQSKGTLAIHEIARTQEVCRDFCHTIHRDVRQARPEEFEAYLNRHSSTPQDLADYSEMLDNIREFCGGEVKLSSLGSEERPQPGNEVRRPSKRDRVSTRQFDPNSDVMKELFMLGGAGGGEGGVGTRRPRSVSLPDGAVPLDLGRRSGGFAAANPSANRVSVNSGLFFPDFGGAAIDSNEATNNPATATPPKPLSAISNSKARSVMMEDTPAPTSSSFAENELIRALEGIDFSMETTGPGTNVLDSTKGITRNPLQDATQTRAGLSQRGAAVPSSMHTVAVPSSLSNKAEANPSADLPGFALSDLFAQNDEDEPAPSSAYHRKVSTSGLIDSQEHPVASASVAAPSAAAAAPARPVSGSAPAAPAPAASSPSPSLGVTASTGARVPGYDEANRAERMRGVDGVEYNFSQESLRKMRDPQVVVKADAAPDGPSPIDPTIVNGFKPYIFDTIYTIDVPLATPSTVRPADVSVMDRYILPLIFPFMMFALAALAMTFSVLMGLPLLALGVIALIFVLPEIAPAVQQTPQATLTALLAARNGRCYGRAASLVAVSKESPQDFDFHELWEPEKAWPVALLRRFSSPKLPDARIITGSERQNAVLLLIPLEDEKQYTLLPLVRIESKWYTTDPSMRPRNIIR